MPDPGTWSVPKRIAFRFGFVAAALYIYPFPIGFIPKTEELAGWMSDPWEALVLWFAETFVGERPVIQPTGSGDTLFAWTSFLLTLILAAIGAGIWTALDRKRTAYPRLAAWTLVVLRYVLAIAMLSYGFAKLINTQFPAPTAHRLDGRIGDMSPMGMLWTFMGSSQTYTMFGGFAEAAAGLLLLFRRTTTLGALVAAAVMTNVVMLNFCYDVPVKLYSMQLLALAILIAAPQLRRLIAAVLGRATEAVPERPRMSLRGERARLAVKVLSLIALAYNEYKHVSVGLEYRGGDHELVGIWTVETWSLDGVEPPPLITDKERWRKVAIGPRGLSVRLLTDERLRAGADVAEATRTIVVRGNPRLAPVVPPVEDSEEPPPGTSWSYTLAGDRLTIEGPGPAGKPLRVTLTRDPDGELLSRGFHWVQEHPYNR